MKPRKLTRRQFLRRTAWAGTGLYFSLPLVAAAKDQALPAELSAFVNIDLDGKVHVFYPKSEMGQGVRTLAACVAAEELEVPLEHVLVHTPTPRATFANMQTGGSYSARSTFVSLRRHFAAIRRMLETAAANEWGVPSDEVHADAGHAVHAASGRRIGYGELAPAAAALPIPQDVVPKARSDFRLLGKSQRSIDVDGIITGQARYGIDVRIDGMIHASLVRAPVVGARLIAVDDSACRSVDGYRGFVRIAGNTVSDFPEYIRDAVAVLAGDTWSAMKAARLVKAEWDLGVNESFETGRYMQDLAERATQPEHAIRIEGDFDSALATADKRVEARYEGPFLAHAPMEPMSAVARVDDGGCEVWTSTHAQSRLLQGIKDLTGLGEDRITIHTPLIGGSFGRRLQVDYALEAVMVARASGQAVKVTWTREEDMRYGCLRSPYVQAMAGAVEGGRVTGFEQTIACSSVWKLREPHMLVDGVDDTVAMPAKILPYAIPAVRIRGNITALPYPIGWWRASYPTIHHTVQECFMDELISAAGADPFDARLEMLAGGETVGYEWLNGWGTDKVDRKRLVRVLENLRQHSGWDRPKPAGVGRGLALSVYSDTHLAQVVELRVERGTVVLHRVTCVVDCGFAINPDTVEAQIQSGVIYGLSAALYGAVTFQRGQVQQSNFSDYRILRLSETPAIDVIIADSDAEVSGVGEPGTHPVMAATCNAMFDAVGIRIRKLPIADQLRGRAEEA